MTVFVLAGTRRICGGHGDQETITELYAPMAFTSKEDAIEWAIKAEIKKDSTKRRYSRGEKMIREWFADYPPKIMDIELVGDRDA